METKNAAGTRKIFLTALLSLIAGCLLTPAFSPFNIYYLAPVSIALLFYTFFDASKKQASAYGFLFGIGFYSTSVYWVCISMYRFGGMNAILSFFITSLFIVVLASLTALLGYLSARFFSNRNIAKYIFALPAAWVLLEWIRGRIFTGFPWVYLGYSQPLSPLAGYAPLAGTYGISFLAALTSGLLLLFFKTKKLRTRSLYLIAILAVWISGMELGKIEWTKPIGRPLKVSLIQGNIPQTIKWSPDQITPTIDRYWNLTNNHWKSDLIIWPEAALPLPMPYAGSVIHRLSNEARARQTALLLGIPVQVNGQYFYNAALALGTSTGSYYKRHLVPFGEYVPFERYFKDTFQFLHIPMSDFISGPAKQSLIWINQVPAAIYICYEIAYSGLVHSDLPGAKLLILLTNDAWFGKSIAAGQHVQIAQMRSLESGRYTLCATNNGITAIISPKGKIIKSLPRFKTAVLNGTVRAMRGAPPWILFGDTPILILMLGLFLFPMIKK